ncbi:uncharacterized protein TNCV_3823131 [Trichonephila clavipes]|nr:uncharacterized protein TNCV_3823131 [Trichonephila clavipes]
MGDTFDIFLEVYDRHGDSLLDRIVNDDETWPLRHKGTLNNRRAASPLMRMVKRKERWDAPDHRQGILPQNWAGTEQNRTVTYMVLESKANDRRKNVVICGDEFRSDRSTSSDGWH